MRVGNIRKGFKQYDVAAYFKAMNTICQLLVKPKDTILKELVVDQYTIFYVICVMPPIYRKIVKSTVFGVKTYLHHLRSVKYI